jgi:hypothetical protein
MQQEETWEDFKDLRMQQKESTNYLSNGIRILKGKLRRTRKEA